MKIEQKSPDYYVNQNGQQQGSVVVNEYNQKCTL